jgi:osmotically-inducible protein OsmY
VTDPTVDAYVIEHVRQALATDERTGVQGLRVTQHGDCVVLAGTVSSTERHDVIEQVAAEAAPGFRICNEIAVVPAGDHHRTEELS